jgi:hypothetical protein
MSQFYEYNWPDTTLKNGIALAQALTMNTPLQLNGPYANKITRTVKFVDDFGIVPRITLSSEADLSRINFLITGYQNGVYISETLKGPTTNTTITSVNCFDTVAQIIPNTTNASTASVGVASVGYFPIILLNTVKQNVAFINYALNIIPNKNNPPSYQIFLSLKNNLGLGKYDDLTSDANGNFIAFAAASNKAALIQSNNLAQNLLIKIDPNAAGSTLKAQFLQL